MNRTKFVLCCALAACKLLWMPESRAATGPLNLPVAAGLSPGDILINDSLSGWIKFAPASNQLFALDWPRPSIGIGGLFIDYDGSIVFRDSISIHDLNPLNGVVKSIGPPQMPARDFVLLPDGDFLFHQPASSSSRNGDVWSGGYNSVFTRYDRETGTFKPIPKPSQFTPRSVLVGSNGEVIVDEFFRGIQEIDLATGSMSAYPFAGWNLRGLMGTFPNGDLAVNDAFTGLSRLNLATGTTTTVSDARLFFDSRIDMDEAGNFWVARQRTLSFIDGATGEMHVRLPDTPYFLPRSLLVIPSDWTPPPVPEPSTLVLALAAGGAGIAARSKRLALL